MSVRVLDLTTCVEDLWWALSLIVFEKFGILFDKDFLYEYPIFGMRLDS
jgi:hypothetical protein